MEGECILILQAALEVANELDHIGQLEATGFWGRSGAGCVFLSKNTGRVMLAHRSQDVVEPDTWGTWGGAIDLNESPFESVQREVHEETGYVGNCTIMPLALFTHPTGFRYQNYLVIVGVEFEPILNWETQSFRWTELEDLPMPLHPGATYLMSESGAELKRIRDSFVVGTSLESVSKSVSMGLAPEGVSASVAGPVPESRPEPHNKSTSQSTSVPEDKSTSEGATVPKNKSLAKDKSLSKHQAAPQSKSTPQNNPTPLTPDDEAIRTRQPALHAIETAEDEVRARAKPAKGPKHPLSH